MTKEEFFEDRAKLVVHFAKIVLIKIEKIESQKNKLGVFFEGIKLIEYLTRYEYLEYLEDTKSYEKIKEDINELL